MKSTGLKICFVLALLNAFVTYRNWIAGVGNSLWRAIKQPQATTDGEGPDYTYIEDDHPLYYPVSSGPLPDVAATIYDSIHYYIDPTDNMSKAAVEGGAEWNHMVVTPSQDARVILGPENRIFLTALWHQMHCLRGIELSIVGCVDPASAYGHNSHCLDYLRQWFLCMAGGATDLEEGDFLDGLLTDGDLAMLPVQEREARRNAFAHYNESGYTAGWKPGRIWGEKVCKDVGILYDDLESNAQRWEDWRQEWN